VKRMLRLTTRLQLIWLLVALALALLLSRV
jgi:hypothetical protein